VLQRWRHSTQRGVIFVRCISIELCADALLLYTGSAPRYPKCSRSALRQELSLRAATVCSGSFGDRDHRPAEVQLPEGSCLFRFVKARCSRWRKFVTPSRCPVAPVPLHGSRSSCRREAIPHGVGRGAGRCMSASDGYSTSVAIDRNRSASLLRQRRADVSNSREGSRSWPLSLHSVE
jgi:hypothetical protein